MNRLIFFIFLGLLAACDSRQGSVLGPPSVAGPSVAPPATMTVGEETRGTFIGNPLTYWLTAPSDGTLVVSLSWNPQVNGARLMLTVGDASFRASPPDWSPVLGRTTVSRGQTYRVTIEEGNAPWDYGFDDAFVLTTAIE